MQLWGSALYQLLAVQAQASANPPAWGLAPVEGKGKNSVVAALRQWLWAKIAQGILVARIWRMVLIPAGRNPEKVQLLPSNQWVHSMTFSNSREKSMRVGGLETYALWSRNGWEPPAFSQAPTMHLCFFLLPGFSLHPLHLALRTAFRQ